MASGWPVGETRFLGLRRRQALVAGVLLLVLAIGAAVSVWVFLEEIGMVATVILITSFAAFFVMPVLYWQFGVFGLLTLSMTSERQRDRR